MKDDLSDAGFETRAVRFAQQRTHEREHSEAIFMTSSFVFDNAAQAAARFSGQEQGNIYGRFHNPTVRTFEQRLASLEGGESCVATASGMSAILATVIALLQAGDHMVASKSLFGSSIALFDNYLKKFGVEVTYVTLSNVDDWAAAVTPATKMLFAETPSNPLTEVCDIQALADVAHDCGALLVVDNCFCTPAIQRPLEFGADIVIHSATKYLDGQGRALGGAVVGNSDLVGDKIFSFLRTAGPSMSPFNAWIFTRGLETLSLRMKAHSENARLIANWLESHDKIERVYYPGLASHPQYEVANKQHDDSGGIVAFDVVGGQEAAWKVMDSLSLMSITANLGDVKTTITHPTSTTHFRISAEQRAAAGIGDGLLRISAGLESANDLIADLDQALN
ncbi:MAG: O-succinylhomoserine sulfhydrylase [Gammaproteobacteria bacterium]|nr:O-succinylhomoserine sulfhydrylase [Gammaproteobacteria bacterium]